MLQKRICLRISGSFIPLILEEMRHDIRNADLYVENIGTRNMMCTDVRRIFILRSDLWSSQFN
jgi:hypothetical protein